MIAAFSRIVLEPGAVAHSLYETSVRKVPATLTAWSRQGDDIISSLTLRSLRKQEMIISLRITVGTDQVKIGEVSLLLSDSEGIRGVITSTVIRFFST